MENSEYLSEAEQLDCWFKNRPVNRALRRYKSWLKFTERKKHAVYPDTPKHNGILKNTPKRCATCCNQHWVAKQYGFKYKHSVQKQIDSLSDQWLTMNTL